MRKMACMSRLFALAEPVPLTVPILNAKSLMGILESAGRTSSCPTRPSGSVRRRGRSGGRRPHPSPSPASSAGAEPSCRCPATDSSPAPRGAGEDPIRPQPPGVIVRQFTGQTSTHASHSMQRFAVKFVSMSQLRQRCTSRAVCSALNPSSTSTSRLCEALHQLLVLHLHARRGAVVVAVAPRVHADLRAHEIHAVGRPLGERRALAMVVDRDRRLMSVLDGPDDVLRSPRGVAAEEDARRGRHHRRPIHHRHPVLVELDPDVALDPRERVLLADREDDVVAREHHRLDDLTLLLSVLFRPAQNLDLHPDELPVLEHEALGRVVLDDRARPLPRRPRAPTATP